MINVGSDLHVFKYKNADGIAVYFLWWTFGTSIISVFGKRRYWFPILKFSVDIWSEADPENAPAQFFLFKIIFLAFFLKHTQWQCRWWKLRLCKLFNLLTVGNDLFFSINAQVQTQTHEGMSDNYICMHVYNSCTGVHKFWQFDTSTMKRSGRQFKRLIIWLSLFIW
jgi:hypothetical protein